MSRRVSSIYAVSLAALVWAGAAKAQTAAPAPGASDASAPTDIVVTAQKRSQNLSDVPLSITAVTGEQMAERGITTVQDLSKLTPGLSFVESGDGVPVYSLRGVGFFDTSIGARPTVSVYLDEAPLPFNVETAGASFDLDRVEVLKGPQGTLFGQNSTGGAINYIAAKPKSTFGVGATASYGSYNDVDLQGYVTGPLAPNVNARLAVRTEQSDGWQKSYTRDDSLGAKNFTQGRFLLDWFATDRLKVSVNLNGFIDRGDTQAGQFIAFVPQVATKVGFVPSLANYPVVPHNDRAADWDLNTPLHKDNHFYQGTVRADYKLNDTFTVTSLSTYSKMDLKQTVDIDGAALENALEHVTGNVSSFFTELRLTGQFDKFTSIVGANYAHDTSLENDLFNVPYSTISQQTEPVAPLDAIAPFGKQTFNTTAVFGDIDYSLTKQIRLHGGVRFTEADLDYDTCTRAGDAATGVGVAALFSKVRAGSGLPALSAFPVGACYSLNANLSPAELTGTFDQNNVSWRLGADYKPMEHMLFYFNVSRGYKAGSIPVTATTSNLQAGPVTQESVLAYEVGTKVSLLERRLDVTGALFDYEYDNKQLKGRVVANPNIFGPLESLVNVPNSRIRGAEAQIIARPLPGLTVSAAATYLDSKVTGQFSNYTILATLRDFSGESFPYTPRLQTNLDINYRHPISDTLDGTLGVDYAYRSSTSAGFGNEPLLKINPYGLLDFQIGIENRRQGWRVEAYGRNVTDAYYWTNVAKFFDDVRRLTGQPATYGVQVSFKY